MKSQFNPTKCIFHNSSGVRMAIVHDFLLVGEVHIVLWEGFNSSLGQTKGVITEDVVFDSTIGCLRKI